MFKIRKEFSFVSNKDYKKGRITFFESCIGLFDNTVDQNIKKLIEYVNKTY